MVAGVAGVAGVVAGTGGDSSRLGTQGQGGFYWPRAGGDRTRLGIVVVGCVVVVVDQGGFHRPTPATPATPTTSSAAFGRRAEPGRRLTLPNAPFATRNDDLRSQTFHSIYETTTYAPKQPVRYTKRRLTLRNNPFAIRNDDLRSETTRSLYETTTYARERTVRYTKRQLPLRNGSFAI